MGENDLITDIALSYIFQKDNGIINSFLVLSGRLWLQYIRYLKVAINSISNL